MKRIFALLAALLVGLCLMPGQPPAKATAGDAQTQEAWVPNGIWEYGVFQVSAQTLGVAPDTRFPVYLAPVENAARAGGGKAAVSAAEPFWVLGSCVDDWTLIQYQVSGGGNRVGWAQLPVSKAGMQRNIPADGRPLRLIRDADLTDDPWGGQRPALRLPAGSEVLCLGRIWVYENDSAFPETNYLYVRTQLESREAWLFLPRDAAEPVPLSHREGETLYVHEGVQALALAWFDENDDEQDKETETLKAALPLTMVALGSVELSDWETGETTTRLILPDSLICLGMESVAYGRLDTLRLPENLRCLDIGAITAVSIGELVIPKGFTLPLEKTLYYSLDRSSVEAFTAEEGNPLYMTRDGVLFSADGKTLIRYPEGNKATHYDVPAGVEEIADFAFASDQMDIPLKTISLPAGLKRIGQHAFSGCGRLLSLTVPLTVTDLSADAFTYCVSLERLSLPPGLDVRWDPDWAERPDFAFFNGDNGGTERTPRKNDWEEN